MSKIFLVSEGKLDTRNEISTDTLFTFSTNPPTVIVKNREEVEYFKGLEFMYGKHINVLTQNSWETHKRDIISTNEAKGIKYWEPRLPFILFATEGAITFPIL